MTAVNLFLFGYPHIEMDGRPAEVDTRKAIALLAYLSLNPAPHSRDVLAGLLWPDYDQTGARAALRRTLSVLNKATGEVCLEISREQVALASTAPLWVDVTTFLHGLESAAALQGQPQLDALQTAVNLARDRFMAGFSLRDAPEFDDWQFFQAENLSRILAGGLERLARAYAAREDYDQAVANARTWLAQDPLMEDAHRLLMDLYARSGQRNAALRQYRECVRVLDQELGVSPLPETTALYQSILENRLQPAAASRQPEVATPPVEDSAPRGPYPLTGRKQELDFLMRAHAAAPAHPQWILLEGEAGIGKTRLAEEFLDRVRRQGGAVLSLRCYEGETGLSYGPFISALSALAAQPGASSLFASLAPQSLAETARLVPEVASLFPGLPPTPAIDGPGAQGRFFESLRQVIFSALAGPGPGVLFIDDLQWADTASFDLLAYLLRRLPGSGLLVLSTWRSDLPGEEPHLAQMINDLQRSGHFQRLGLARLGPADIARLAAQAAGSSPLPGGFADRLYHETEGLPFFVVEYLGTALGGAWELPASVRDVLQHRIAGMDETSGQLLGAAAVIGRSFRFNTLHEVSGRSELETISGLETLLSRGVIIERAGLSESGEVSYDFTHDKLRELVYSGVSLARRRLLHRRAAEALVSENGRRDAGPLAAVVAQHYLLSGQNDLAAVYYRQAGDYARALYANRDALAHYQAAVAAGHPDLAGLHEAAADLHTLLGEYRAALDHYEAAASQCDRQSSAGSACLAALERKLGQVHARLGNWDLSESHFRAALEAGGDRQPGVYADWSHVAAQRGDLPAAQRLAARALEMAREGDDPVSLAGAHNISGILARRQGDFASAAAHLERCLEIARAQGSESMCIAAQNNLSRVYAEMGRPQEAVQLIQSALASCRRLGDRHREAALLNNLADLLYSTGQTEEAMQLLKDAVTIFAEIGVEAGAENVEIWKLTEW